MKRRTFLMFGLFVLWASSLSAAVLEQLSLEELTERADLIVIGTVTAQAYVVDEKRRAVLTRSTITVERTLMGKTVDAFALTQLGGKAGSVVTRVAGDAQLKVDDRVLLFPFEHDDKARYLVGLALGAWRVRGPPANPTFTQRIDALLASKTGKILPAPGLREATLDDVKAAIERVASSGNSATSERLQP